MLAGNSKEYGIRLHKAKSLGEAVPKTRVRGRGA